MLDANECRDENCQIVGRKLGKVRSVKAAEREEILHINTYCPSDREQEILKLVQEVLEGE